MQHIISYRNATPKGEPIFIFKNSESEKFIKATNIQEYQLFRNACLISQTSTEIEIPTHCYIDGIPILMDTRKYIAYSHLYGYNSFQYTMQKQLIGFAHIINEENKDVLVFEKNKNLEDFMYRTFGRDYNNLDLFKSSNYERFQEMLQSIYKENKIEPIFTFNGIAYDLIIHEIENSLNNPVKFLHKHTPLSFN